jgi:3-(3-hydroxy-phenyl)propionate hydroxylase
VLAGDAYDADVLVVGLGPTGDVLSALLAQSGLTVIALDKSGEVYAAPRAAVFDHEVMRTFQAVGIADEILAASRVAGRYEFVTADGEVLIEFDTALQTRSGWAENYVLHQPSVERALRARLAPLGVDVRTPVTLLDLAEHGAGVDCRVRGPQGDYSLRTRWVVGCDGAASRVRELLGIGLFDYQFDEPWLVIDAIADEPGDLPQRIMQLCDPKRPITYLKMCANRYRWEFMLLPGENPAEIATDASIRSLLAPWKCFERLKIERRAVYRFHGLVARQWRRGRVLLAGDAAHQMPPFAGQGMCAGVRDAVNLAWKLGAVVRAEAAPALLDTYQLEREPHVRAVIEIAIAMGRVVCLLDPGAAAARNAQMLARKAAGERDIALAFPDLKGGLLTELPGAGTLFPQAVTPVGRLDDGLGAGAWLIGKDLPDTPPPGVRAISIDDAVLAPFAGAVGKWLEDHASAAVLVRPDRYVFGAGAAAALADRWREMLNESVALPS